MPTQFDDGDFTTAQPNGAERVDRPFAEQGDSDTQVIFRPMLVNKADYVKLPLDTPHPTVTDAYLTTEKSFENYGTGLISFERVYAQIPVSRLGVFTGSQAFTYPGYNTEGNTDGTVRTITNITENDTVSTLIVNNTVTIGDVVSVSASWTGAIGVAFGGFRVALSGTTASQVKVALIPSGDNFDFGFLIELDFEPRASESTVTGSITDFTYFLPGVTPGISLPTDVVEDGTFKILDTNTLASTSILSTATIPNFVGYQSKIDAGEYLIASSKVTRWRGNILQKANLKVRAL